jgi:hypothetical protein
MGANLLCVDVTLGIAIMSLWIIVPVAVLLIGGYLTRRSGIVRATLTDADGNVTADVHFTEPVGVWAALRMADEAASKHSPPSPCSQASSRRN